jgi:OmpA-OmpF porin, OOP family
MDANMRLSQERTQSVVNYLITQGIDEKKLVAKGYGPTKPIAPNTNEDGSDNPEGRAKNRRIEMKILEVSGK